MIMWIAVIALLSFNLLELFGAIYSGGDWALIVSVNIIIGIFMIVFLVFENKKGAAHR